MTVSRDAFCIHRYRMRPLILSSTITHDHKNMMLFVVGCKRGMCRNGSFAKSLDPLSPPARNTKCPITNSQTLIKIQVYFKTAIHHDHAYK